MPPSSRQQPRDTGRDDDHFDPTCGLRARGDARVVTGGRCGHARATSRPEAVPAKTPLPLTPADAIARGLQHNLQAVLAAQNVEAASGAHQVARAALLPAVDVGARAARQKISLEEFGLAPARASPRWWDHTTSCAATSR